MTTRIGKKIGMALMGGSMALLIPFTAAAQDRNDHRFDRDEHQVVQQRVEQRSDQSFGQRSDQRFDQRFDQHRQPVRRVVERRDVRDVRRAQVVTRGSAYEEGFRAGANSRVGNGYYDSFGNWCAR